MPIDIVVDAMGSDKSPESEIRGAILASRHLGVRVHLVGPEQVLRPALDRALRSRFPVRYGRRRPQIEIVHSSEWISMDDRAAQAVRAKRDSSMRVGLRMVRDGAAAGFFTATRDRAGFAGASPAASAATVLAGTRARPGLADASAAASSVFLAAARARRGFAASSAVSGFATALAVRAGVAAA